MARVGLLLCVVLHAAIVFAVDLSARPPHQAEHRLLVEIENKHNAQKAQHTTKSHHGGPVEEMASVVMASAIHTVERDDRGGSPDGQCTDPCIPPSVTPTPPPSDPAHPVCGPDVTTQFQAALAKTTSTFGTWSDTVKDRACQALISFRTGDVAWDINELHNNCWILNWRPACATQGANPHCGSTVQIGTDCYYAGSPNYAVYGIMMKLCSDFYTAKGDTSNAGKFTLSEVISWIELYKGKIFIIRDPAPNLQASKDWATAGYNGYPTVAGPAGDRPSCSPTCPLSYGAPPTCPAAWHVHWIRSDNPAGDWF